MLPVQPKETEVDGRKFRLNGISARFEVHVLRLMGPFLAATQAVKSKNAAVEAPLIALQQMPMSDVDWVMNVCLASVTTEDSGKWLPIMNGNGKLQYGDIGGAAQLKLTQEVIELFSDPFFKVLTGES